MFHEVFMLFFSSSNSLTFLSKLFILVSISSNLFSRFLVSLHWVRTCSCSSEKFLFTYLLKSDSIISSHSFSVQLCFLAGEESWSIVGGEVLWFWVFSSFVCWFIPIFVNLSTYGLCNWLLLYGVSEWMSFLLIMKLFLSVF